MKPPTAFFSNDDYDTPEKCRNRRLRRINMRRMRNTASFPRVSRRSLQVVDPQLTPSVKNPMPEYGCISIQGLCDSMNDAVLVKKEFFRPDILGGMPVHFFAVYDCHGRSHVSEMCKKMMHRFMEEELTRVQFPEASAATGGRSHEKKKQEDVKEADEDEWEHLVRVAVEKSFARMDKVVLSTCACGKTDHTCGCQPMDLASAGSTAATVAVVSRSHVVVANCGNSRAVFCRDGIPVPHSLDYKPERQDESGRIRTTGGKLVHQKGVRVYGGTDLNVSRCLEPEISFKEREYEDEFLIIASDGIWDVISEDLACRIASECLREGGAATAARSRYSGRGIKDYGAQVLCSSSTSNLAATILCRLALARGSRDNISVMVVDLNKKKKANK